MTLKNFLQYVCFKCLLRRAHALAATGNFDLALSTLTGTRFASDINVPSRLSPLIVNIFYADLCQRMERMKEAFDGCEIAIRQLTDERLPFEDVYSSDEIKYLQFRCKWIVSGVSRFVDSIAFKTALAIDTTSRDFDVSKVRLRIRRLFPMSEKDGMALDSYIEENKTASNG